jgi:probable addiction module antidote protein
MKTTKFDVQEHLKTKKARTAYLKAVLEDGDPDLLAAALGDIARSIGTTRFAHDTGLSRETIYKSLRQGGNPTLDTLAKSVKALGLRLSLTTA